MNDSKSGKVGKRLIRRVLASWLTIGILVAMGILFPMRGARTHQSSDRGLTAEDDYKTDSLAEWHVFLAATNHYPEGSEDLHCAEADVDELLCVLKALGVKDDNITALKTSNIDPYQMPLKSSFDEKYDDFLDSLTDESIAFVFLVGHGFCEDEDNGKTMRSYYAPCDFRHKNKDEKKISIDNMMERLATTPARFKWFCVDAGRSPLEHDADEKRLSISDIPQGLVLTQSCKFEQLSYELWGNDAPYENGLFTRAFVDAISGRSPGADKNRDGVVTMGEIRDYVETRVPFDAEKYIGGEQNPTFTTMKGVSFDEEFARYPLFQDLPIFGHHPEEWREGQRLREEAEALVKQEKYREAGFKIQAAYRILPDVDEIIQIREKIKELYYENVPQHGASFWYEKAVVAYREHKYQDALSNISKAVELDKDNATYIGYKELIQDAIKLYSQPSLSPQPPTHSSNRNAGESRTITIGGVNVVFHWCPPTGPDGFKMGSPTNEKDRYDGEILHTVVITKGFWMAETETTQELWKVVMGQGNNPSSNKGDNLPVENICWNDCQDFIKKLNEKMKNKGFQFRLPSEAHWEYACRAGTTTPFSWGDDWDSSKENRNEYKTMPVGSFNYSNNWGLKDMHGNVAEMCSDWYGDYPEGTVTDPEGPNSGSHRVSRGGGYLYRPEQCRSACRFHGPPWFQSTLVGFRLEMGDVVERQKPSLLTKSTEEQNLLDFSISNDPISINPKAGEPRTIEINGIKVIFHWCPPTGPDGFKMGSPTSEDDRRDTEMQHQVVITKGFWLAEMETTQALWKVVMGKKNNPSLNKGDNLPVEKVSWNDCQDFIERLNEKMKDKGIQFSLPSEAHWEYACRAGTTTRYCWGDNWDPTKGDRIASMAKPVGSYNYLNNWGLKDMHGNVSEWCSDWYGDYPEDTVTDPEGPSNGSQRVYRGGSWISEPRYCRSAQRGSGKPSGFGYDRGFRLEMNDVSE